MATGACTIELSHAFPPIVLYKGQGDELTPGPEPIAATADFRYRCGDCTATGPVCFNLKRAALKTAGGKRELYVLVEVDNRAVLPCHPLNPLNGQRYSAAPFKADFILPWEEGYVLSRPVMWFHLALRLGEK